MIALIVAALQAASPATPIETVECAVTGRHDHGQLSDIGFACPQVSLDPDGLLAAARGVASRLEPSYDLSDFNPTSIVGTVEFRHEDGAWRLPEPTPFFSVTPDYPARAAEAGRNGHCDLRFTLTPSGRPEAIDVACAQFTNSRRTRDGRVFEREAREAGEHFVYFMPEPGAHPGCAETYFDFLLNGDVLGEPVNGAPRCPGESGGDER